MRAGGPLYACPASPGRAESLPTYGHNWLALQLKRRRIPYRMLDNAFAHIGDWSRAQEIADRLEARRIHERLDRFARQYCPIIEHFDLVYHWSLNQCEYATDVVFRRQADLGPIYANLTRTAIHTVKPDNIATFLGRKLHPNYQDEMGNRFNIRIEGARIEHTMGPVSLKLYDKSGLILRIETTVNDVSFFKHYRKVEHRNGACETKWAPMRKTIYSLPPLAERRRRKQHGDRRESSEREIVLAAVSSSCRSGWSFRPDVVLSLACVSD